MPTTTYYFFNDTGVYTGNGESDGGGDPPQNATTDAPDFSLIGGNHKWDGKRWEFVKEVRVPEPAKVLRAVAFAAESDPLFFKWHRGESTEQEWLDKVAKIKERYPDESDE